MHAELANHRQIGRHFGGVHRRDHDRFAADEDVERAGIENDPAVFAVDLFPVLGWVVMGQIDRSITPVCGLAR